MIKKIVSALLHYRTFLITSHTNPDGDSIGSQIALALLLKRLNKKVTIIDENPVPQIYRFLPHSDFILTPTPDLIRGSTPNSFQAAIVLDCGNLERVGKVGSLIKGKPCLPAGRPIINIDHHLDNDLFGSLNWVDKKASSVAEQIFFISKILGLTLNKKLATLLYTGIITDTGSFQYHLSPFTHKIVGTLVSKGAVPEEITKNVYQSLPFAAFKLFGLALSTLRQTENHKVCWMRVTKEMYRKTKTSPEDTEPFINYLQQIKDLKILFILKEASRNKTK
ncbi:MAG: bifunctional oligoribonuclease/PAP phosphatase NrnA, partial [Candidatus Omnitrophica bacterium]|nr:bifunctional oligoribonuclease/PAP phosphatase NrnA [Candidatus Omnitrophota bacterium]